MSGSTSSTTASMIKWLKILLKSLIGLAISVGLTLLAIAFIPSAFKFGLSTTLNLLSEDKFTIYGVDNTTQLREHFAITQPTKNDKELLNAIEENFSETRGRDTFFAHMFVALDYPEQCQMTFVGKHRLYNIAWVVQSKECRKPKKCKGKSEEECKELYKRREK